MAYLVLKALHVAAAVAWIGGMAVAGFAIARLSSTPGPRAAAETRLLDAAHRWDRRATAPAMGIVWLLGVTLAIWSGSFGTVWLAAKLAIVVALSALHGLQAGTLRRLRDRPDQGVPALVRASGPAALAAVVPIALLVVTKPFG